MKALDINMNIEEPTPSGEPLDWQFSQVFGERAPNEDIQDGETLNWLSSVT